MSKIDICNENNDMPPPLRISSANGSAHKHLDESVFAAYCWKSGLSEEEILEKLLELNFQRAEQE